MDVITAPDGNMAVIDSHLNPGGGFDISYSALNTNQQKRISKNSA